MIKHDLHYRRLPSGFPEIQHQDISGTERDDKGGLCHYLRRFWRSLELPYRINHVSWWQQELPSQEEMEEGRRNLAAYGNAVDFIVTHCCASSTQILLGGAGYRPDIETAYLEEILRNTRFRKWFFGHYHGNRNVNAREILIYEQMIRIS